jgi:hypothetical protein
MGQDPGLLRDTAPGIQRLTSADGDTPEPPVDRVRAASPRGRQAAFLEEGDLLFPAPGVIPDRREHFQIRLQGAKRDLEADLVIAGGSAPVRHRTGPKVAGNARHGLGLQHALRADAQGIEPAAPDVAEDEEPQYPVEELATGIHNDMADCPELGRTPFQVRAGLVIEPARVHGDGNDWPAVGFCEPGNTEGGVQASGEGQKDGFVRGHDRRALGNTWSSRASSSCC